MHFLFQFFNWSLCRFFRQWVMPLQKFSSERTLHFILFVQARYEYLVRESDKKLETGLQHIKVPETATAGKSSPPGRRKTSTKDLAHAAAKEVKEAAKESRAALKDASKESEMESGTETASAALKDVAVKASASQAEAVDDAYKAETVLHPPPALDEDKNEPKDLLIAMDSFDNLFCRRCLVCT